MKTAVGLFAVLFALSVASAVETNALPSGQSVAAEIQKELPEGWSLTLIDEKGKMGHPHGLEEPLFRIDFVNTNVTISIGQLPGTSATLSIHPNLRLDFHSQADRDETLKIIEKEKIFSWDIPTLFGETKDFVIVGSPMWHNRYKNDFTSGGDFSAAGNRALHPLLEALRKYVDIHKRKKPPASEPAEVK
jgi:hypothetical protein